MVSGMFFAFAAIKYGAEKFRTGIVNRYTGGRQAGKWFSWIVTLLIPVEFVVLIAWWFWQAATEYDPEGWWMPFRKFSLGTCLFQWGIAIVLFLVLNNRLYEWSVASRQPEKV
jgi:NSS family neurotransmitter:Na+ symporter